METTVETKVVTGVNIDRDVFDYVERRRRVERRSRSAMINLIIANEARRVPIPEDAPPAPPVTKNRRPGKSPG